MNRYITPLLLLAITFAACRNDEYIEAANYKYVDDNDDVPYDESQVDLDSYPDWTAVTHGNDVAPNFEEVFFEGVEAGVKQLYLTISSSNWSAMWSDLSSNLGSSSSNRFGVTNAGGVSDIDFTPVWVPCTVNYNGSDWYEVGVRFKGNSSLSSAYSSGVDKLSMKLDFDQYEYQYPALTNQRFYGFKQLNLNNNYNDLSFMREKVTSDLFREFIGAAAHTSFCEVYINNTYYGLYTIVEEVDDTVIESQFTAGGNCYKPEDDAAYFKSGSYDTDEFYLKTNTSNPDYSDVKALYDAINATNRTSNTAEWKATLEAAFDVDIFLKWLAANTAVQNWDAYGNMAHNYYLYNNPETNKLTWIPWDHNESLQSSTGNYTDFLPSYYSNSKYTGTTWPLLYYIMNNSDYSDIFYAHLKDFLENYFDSTTMIALYNEYEALIQTSAYNEVTTSIDTFLSSKTSFNTAVTYLETHVNGRHSTLNSYIQ